MSYENKGRKNNEFNWFILNHSKTINLCKAKFNIPENLALYKAYVIMNKRGKINNIDGYIYTTLRNLKSELCRLENKERKIKQSYSKDKLICKFHSNLGFYNLLKGLNAIYKEILILRYIHNMTIREIGNKINLPKSTVH